jgi:pimeloyl-ACP methyl ester carboxylesterase
MAWPPTGNRVVDVVSHEQMRRSWYVFFLRQRGVEHLIAPELGEFLSRLWTDWSPNNDSRGDVSRALAALQDREHLAAAIGYYRALPDLDDPDARPLVGGCQPTLYLHGTDDGCLGVETVQGADDRLSAPSTVLRLPGVGHFPQLEAPDRVNRLVLDFLGSDPLLDGATANE